MFSYLASISIPESGAPLRDERDSFRRDAKSGRLQSGDSLERRRLGGAWEPSVLRRYE